MIPEMLGAPKLNGTAFRQEVFVHVSWPWLIWPTSLTLCGLILLAVSILRSERRPDLLKSSSLALLCHGLHEFEDGQLRPTPTEDERTLEKTAKEMREVLQRDEHGTLKFEKC